MTEFACVLGVPVFPMRAWVMQEDHVGTVEVAEAAFSVKSVVAAWAPIVAGVLGVMTGLALEGWFLAFILGGLGLYVVRWYVCRGQFTRANVLMRHQIERHLSGHAGSSDGRTVVR